VNRSAERRQQVSQGLRQALARTIVTPYGEFHNQVTWREETGTKLSFADKMRLLPHLYYYKDQGPGRTLYQKVYYSPYGVWYNSRGIWQVACAKGCREAVDFKPSHANTYEWFHRMMRKQPKQFRIEKEPKREWDLETEPGTKRV